VTKGHEIRQTRDQLAKAKVALEQLERLSMIEQPLPGSGDQLTSTAGEIERAKEEVQRLQDKWKRLLGKTKK
jgi:hypothetical protein